MSKLTFFFNINFFKFGKFPIFSGNVEIDVSDISNTIKLFKVVNDSGNLSIFGQFNIYNSDKLCNLFISSGISPISESINCKIDKFLKLYNSSGNSINPVILNA